MNKNNIDEINMSILHYGTTNLIFADIKKRFKKNKLIYCSLK